MTSPQFELVKIVKSEKKRKWNDSRANIICGRFGKK